MTGHQHRLNAIGSPEFRKIAVMCLLHGRLGDLQFVGDVFIELPHAQHAEHTELLRRELGHALRHIENRAIAFLYSPPIETLRRDALSLQNGLHITRDLAWRSRRLGDESLRT